MKKITVAMVVLGTVVFSTITFAQGESALPFLLISPYAEANGMGETSVAYLTDDPLALMTNPAHLGMQSQGNYFSFGYNYAKWLPRFQQADLWLKNYAFTAGINLKKAFDVEPEISFGLAYSRVYLNLGTFTITGSDPTPLATFEGYEKSDQYSLGFGLNYWVKLSAGVTFKNVVSNLAPISGLVPVVPGREASASVNTYDVGLLLDVPVIGILSRLREEPISFSPSVSPFLDFTVGFANNNLGDKEVIYIDPAQGDPLPRYARAGIGFEFGITSTQDDVEWQPLSFKWTIEANDILVVRHPNVIDTLGNVSGGGWEYQHGLGDIKFFDEVILGHTNTETIKKKGWEINVYKIISLRGGRFEEDQYRGNRRFNTLGYTVQSEGIFKLLRAMDESIASNTTFEYIANHVNIRYNHSELSTDEPNNPLSGTTFNSINLLISN